MNDSFVSAVEHPRNAELLIVRARIKDDLETLLGRYTKVFTTEERDYRFRAIVKKKHFAEVMKQRVLEIDYGNFKNSTKTKMRHDVYLKVWDVMYCLQEKLYSTTDWWVNYRNRI